MADGRIGCFIRLWFGFNQLVTMETVKYKIIRHKNPKGRTTWYRAMYWDESGQIHKSAYYRTGNKCTARRAAQSWLYANIKVWCKVANVEQRVVGPDGKSTIVQQGTEEII